jgi:hypothetical protein
MKLGLTKEPGFSRLLPLIFFSLLLFPPCSRAQGRISCFPNLIQVTTFFHGTWVKIYGTCPSGCKVLVEIVGEDAKEIFMKKGKYGPLWMNVAEIRIEEVPNLYLLLGQAGKSPATVADETDFPKGKNYGYGQLRQRVRISGSLVDQRERVKLFQEFVNLKESESLYGLLPNAIHIESGSDEDFFTGRFWLSPKVPLGDYEVRLLLVTGDKILRGDPIKIKIVRVGLPAMMSLLALQHPALYGFLAVFVAIATGLLIGVIFRNRNGRH